MCCESLMALFVQLTEKSNALRKTKSQIFTNSSVSFHISHLWEMLEFLNYDKLFANVCRVTDMLIIVV